MLHESVWLEIENNFLTKNDSGEIMIWKIMHLICFKNYFWVIRSGISKSVYQ